MVVLTFYENHIIKIIDLLYRYADSTSGLTWGGQTYETSDALVSGELNVKTVPVREGLSISETEVVLLTFSSEQVINGI
jgi:hypothetical protein